MMSIFRHLLKQDDDFWNSFRNTFKNLCRDVPYFTPEIQAHFGILFEILPPRNLKDSPEILPQVLYYFPETHFLETIFRKYIFRNNPFPGKLLSRMLNAPFSGMIRCPGKQFQKILKSQKMFWCLKHNLIFCFIFRLILSSTHQINFKIKSSFETIF